jgi:hypothetical protein
MTTTEASFEVKNDAPLRTIFVRMTGLFDAEAMESFAREYLAATDQYRGESHLVLADMRGMRPAGADVAASLGNAIGTARKRGVFCCAHISDSTVQRLQARRVARENTDGDDVTVDVVSEAEAHRVLAEKRAALMKRSRG